MNLQEWESGKSQVIPGKSLYFPPGWEILINPGILPTLIEGQGHFLTLAQGCVHTKIQTRFSQKLRGLSQKFLDFIHNSNNFLVRDKIITLPITLIFSERYGKNS